MNEPPENDEDIKKAEETTPPPSELLTPQNNNLKTIRGLRQKTQEAMAEFLGVSVSTIKNWEAGRDTYETTYIWVADKLGLAPEDIWPHLKKEPEEQQKPIQSTDQAQVVDTPTPLLKAPEPVIPLENQVPGNASTKQPSSPFHRLINRRNVLIGLGTAGVLGLGGLAIYEATYPGLSHPSIKATSPLQATPTHPSIRTRKPTSKSPSTGKPAEITIGKWIATGTMATRRYLHSATVLKNGTVLVAAGRESETVLVPFAELYDPIRGIWHTAAHLNTPRETLSNSLVTLRNEKALLVGGVDTAVTQDYASAELYDLKTNLWLPTGSLSTPRRSATVTLLKDRRVLAAAGSMGPPSPDQFLSSAEIYDPDQKLWFDAGALKVARQGAQAVLLQNGLVMIAGGEGPSETFGTTVELFDPITKIWYIGSDMLWGWTGASMTVLLDGRVLVAGGELITFTPSGTTATVYPSAALYDPDKDSWAYARPMSIERSEHTATLLPNGHVLVIGGRNTKEVHRSCEIYDPQADMWSPGPTLLAPRRDHIVVSLQDSDILIIGGLFYDLHSELDTCERLQINIVA